MAEGMSFSFPSLLFHEGRTYGQPEVVRISLPQVATGLRSRLPGSFRRRAFHADLLMSQEALFARGAHSMQTAMRRALLRRGRSGNAAFSKIESNVAGNLCRMCRKEESRHGGSVMAEGVGFPFPSLPLNEGRTYGQPEVVLISLPQDRKSVV